MLSPADRRVISLLSARSAGVASIARECFQTPGAPAHSAIRPAAAHLARMAARGLVRRVGNLYELPPAPPSTNELTL